MYLYMMAYLISQAGAIAKQAFSKALSRPTRSQTGPRLEFHSQSTNRSARSRSPSPRPSRRHTDLAPLDEDLFADPLAEGGAKKSSGRPAKFDEGDLFSDPLFAPTGREGQDGGKGGSKKSGRVGRFKIVGETKKSSSLERGKEMRYNPRVCATVGG